MLDVRFSSALKAMLLLGHAEEEGSPVLSSTQLARSLDTNPSLVRKLMVPLVRDGLVASIKGRSGGFASADPRTGSRWKRSTARPWATSRCGPPVRRGRGSAWSPTTPPSTSSGSPTRPRPPSWVRWQTAPLPTASTSCEPSTGLRVHPLHAPVTGDLSDRAPRPGTGAAIPQDRHIADGPAPRASSSKTARTVPPQGTHGELFSRPVRSARIAIASSKASSLGSATALVAMALVTARSAIRRTPGCRPLRRTTRASSA